MSPEAAALLAGIAFPASLKLIDWLLQKSGRKTSERKDLREEVALLWARNDTVSRQVEVLEGRVLTLQTENVRLLLEVQECREWLSKEKEPGHSEGPH